MLSVVMNQKSLKKHLESWTWRKMLQNSKLKILHIFPLISHLVLMYCPNNLNLFYSGAASWFANPFFIIHLATYLTWDVVFKGAEASIPVFEPLKVACF